MSKQSDKAERNFHKQHAPHPETTEKGLNKLSDYLDKNTRYEDEGQEGA